MDKALEIIDLLEYIIDASKNTKKDLPTTHMIRVLSELRQIITETSTKKTNELQNFSTNFVSDLKEERFKESMGRNAKEQLEKSDFAKNTSGLGISGFDHVAKDNITKDNSEYNSFPFNDLSEKNNSSIRKNKLASRIKPMPTEVRGRVRELVELISDDNQQEEAFENN